MLSHPLKMSMILRLIGLNDRHSRALALKERERQQAYRYLVLSR